MTDRPAFSSHEPLPSLSVRADAERFVTPDWAEMSSTIELVRDNRDEALASATDAVGALREGLRQLGAVVNDVTSLRLPLRWSTRRVVATPEYERGGNGETGRFVGSANVGIYVRDFELLEAVEQLSRQIEGFRINFATWQVDSDNPVWGEVRLEAIDAAMRKGRDYAAALGSDLLAVEHIADSGLLGPDSSGPMRGAAMSAGGQAASFDPVPQRVAASVEARFVMRVVPLPTD